MIEPRLATLQHRSEATLLRVPFALNSPLYLIVTKPMVSLFVLEGEENIHLDVRKVLCPIRAFLKMLYLCLSLNSSSQRARYHKPFESSKGIVRDYREMQPHCGGEVISSKVSNQLRLAGKKGLALSGFVMSEGCRFQRQLISTLIMICSNSRSQEIIKTFIEKRDKT
ncbi:hypothetical protein Tco_0814263 [Tanacetum coccineum]